MLCSVKVVGFGVDFVIYCFMKLKEINNFSVVYVWFRIDIPYVITLSWRNDFLSIFAKFLWADLNLVLNSAENTLMWPHKLAQLWRGSTVHFNKCIPFLCTKYQKHGSESNITKSEKACTQLLLAAASLFQVVSLPTSLRTFLRDILCGSNKLVHRKALMRAVGQSLGRK